MHVNNRVLHFFRISNCSLDYKCRLRSFERYEKQLDIRWTEQKLEWDYWNSVIFVGTVCTTIGKQSEAFT